MKKSTMLREVKVQEAIGMVLAHDLTQILPGEFKGRLFKKGHVITPDDVPKLLSIGKEHIYTLNLQAGYLHEDEAAYRMARASLGEHVTLSEPHEGKITMKSAIHGLAKINKALVDQMNAIDQIVMSTIKTDTVVQAGQALAGTRVIPLIIEETKIHQVEVIASSKVSMEETEASNVISVKPFKPLKVGLVTTGNEVYSGRIQDKFGPAVKQKVAQLGSEVIEQRMAPDDAETIVQHIQYFKARGVDVILLTGGMSVDPDDRTPGAIKQAGARIVSYGTPMLPGSMLLMAYLDDIPVMGLPGCVMHDPYTSFDVLFPRICAGETITKQAIVDMGYGGLYGC